MNFSLELVLADEAFLIQQLHEMGHVVSTQQLPVFRNVTFAQYIALPFTAWHWHSVDSQRVDPKPPRPLSLRQGIPCFR